VVFAVSYLRGVAQAAERRDTSLLLIPVSHEDDEAALRAVRNAAVDAFCVYNLPDWHRALDVVRARGLPVVGGFDPAALDVGEMYAGVDDRAAARRIAEHVVAFGHRRVAMISEWVTRPGGAQLVTGVSADDPPYYVTRERLRGFRDAFAAVGRRYQPRSAQASWPKCRRRYGMLITLVEIRTSRIVGAGSAT
jgi:DNA-binding LacI/PurR family transcriptional regulator